VHSVTPGFLMAIMSLGESGGEPGPGEKRGTLRDPSPPPLARGWTDCNKPLLMARDEVEFNSRLAEESLITLVAAGVIPLLR